MLTTELGIAWPATGAPVTTGTGAPSTLATGLVGCGDIPGEVLVSEFTANSRPGPEIPPAEASPRTPDQATRRPASTQTS